jgi:threonine dehydrogenase-like Zn-dependent dehydrogenase
VTAVKVSAGHSCEAKEAVEPSLRHWQDTYNQITEGLDAAVDCTGSFSVIEEMIEKICTGAVTVTMGFQGCSDGGHRRDDQVRN